MHRLYLRIFMLTAFVTLLVVCGENVAAGKNTVRSIDLQQLDLRCARLPPTAAQISPQREKKRV